MAETNEIYVKVGLDTKQFDSSLTGIRREMAALKGVIGSSLLSKEDNDKLKARFGELKGDFDDLRASASNVDTGDVFGNMARFAGVASNAVAGLTGVMSLLGVESEKAGEVEKKILQFMAVGNALQSLADSKRLITLGKIYATKIAELFVTQKQVQATQSLSQEITDTTKSQNTNTASNLAGSAATQGLTKAVLEQKAAYISYQTVLDNVTSQMGVFSKAIETIGLKPEQLPMAKSLCDVGSKLDSTTTKLNNFKNAGGKIVPSVILKSLRELGLEVDKTGNIIDKTGNNFGNFGSKVSTTTKLISFLPIGFQSAATAAANFGRTLLVSLGWMAAFAIAITGLIWAFNKLFLEESNQVKAEKEVQAAIKTSIDLMKDYQKQIEGLRNEIGTLDDKIAVLAGRMTETQAKRNEISRKYWEEYKREEQKQLLELAEINRKYQAGEIEGEYLFQTMKQSVKTNFDNWNKTRIEKMNKELIILDKEAGLAIIEKNKANADTRIQLEKATREKLLQIWQETWDQYNRLILNMYSTDTQELSLKRSEEIRKRQLEMENRYFQDLNTIKQSNLFGDIEISEYNRILDMHKQFNADSKQLITDDSDYKIEEQIRVSNLAQQQLKFNFDKELAALDKKIADNEKLKKDASKKDYDLIIKNDEILDKTRVALINDFNNTQEKLVTDQGVKIKQITDDNNKKLLDVDVKFLEDRVKLWNDKISLQKNLVDSMQTAEKVPTNTFKDVQANRKAEVQVLDELKNTYIAAYDARMKWIESTMTGEERVIAETQALDDLNKSLDETVIKIDEIQTQKPLDNFSLGWDPKVIGKDFKENWLSYMQDLANKTGEIMTAAIDSYIEQNARAMEMQLQQMDQALTQEKDNLQTLLDEQLITRKQYDDKVAAAEKNKMEQERQMKRAQFQKEKQASILKAVINGALAVVSAYASAGNPILGAIFASLTAALVATQIGLIAKQPVPEYELGGEVSGPSHSSGGVPIVAEGGEYIVRKSVVQQPGMLQKLDGLNNGLIPISNNYFTSNYSYGTPKFANGGVIPTNNTSQMVTNNYNTNGGFDESSLRKIVTEVVAGTSSIPVNVTEYDVSKVQRKVSVMEQRSKW